MRTTVGIGAVFLGAGALIGATPPALGSQSFGELTFEQRVDCQRRVEQVYWRHRIWPADTPTPKPSFDEAVPREVLESKVKSYLGKSATLQVFRNRPIGTLQLQAELDRIVRSSRRPEVLEELLSALDNDPFLAAECLARPLLADRLLQTVAAGEELAFNAVRLEPSGPYHPMSATRTAACIHDTWTPTSQGANVPEARGDHTMVWTGAEAIVWGGGYATATLRLDSGARYDPATDSWTATSLVNAPTARVGHTAVWTGTEMIVWGGIDSSFRHLSTGGRYNPATDTWAPTLPRPGAARAWHGAVWTGTEMIIWGGNLQNGDRYNPTTDTWQSFDGTGVPRFGHSLWAGAEMIFWPPNTGTVWHYDPSADSWRSTSTVGEPGDGETVWTGTELIAIGSDGSGGRYDPSANSWTPTGTGAPAPGDGHRAVWTGHWVIVWGKNGGGRYDLAADRWTLMTVSPETPSSREDFPSVWTGTEMIVWGGRTVATSTLVATGGRYCLCDNVGNDVDGDGFRGPCDCDDADPTVNVDGVEICNGIDDDCNGLVDEDETGEDYDGDGVNGLCDNCPNFANPTQSAVVLGEQIFAEITWFGFAQKTFFFGWATPADIIWIEGTLAVVGSYVPVVTVVLPLAVSFTDNSYCPPTECPSCGTGCISRYYLVKPDCPVGSWQTSLGAEPARDAVLP